MTMLQTLENEPRTDAHSSSPCIRYECEQAVSELDRVISYMRERIEAFKHLDERSVRTIRIRARTRLREIIHNPFQKPADPVCFNVNGKRFPISHEFMEHLVVTIAGDLENKKAEKEVELSIGGGI